MNGTHAGRPATGARLGPVPYFVLGLALILAINFAGMGAVSGTARWFGLVPQFGTAFYWRPFAGGLSGVLASIVAGDADDGFVAGAVLAATSPFLVGLAILTVRRLRDAGWPRWPAALLALPGPISLVAFVVYAMIPARGPVEGDGVDLADAIDVPDGPKRGGLGRLVPRDHDGAARLAAILIPLPPAALVCGVAVYGLREYGGTVFLGAPFVLPMTTVILYGWGRRPGVGACLGLGMLWLAAVLGLLLVLLLEGSICIMMAAPLMVPCALLGSWLGYLVVRRIGPGYDATKLILALLACLPAMAGAEHAAMTEPPTFRVSTRLEIDAPPELVWPRLVEFDGLPEPSEPIFLAGVAYPIRARLDPTRGGTVRLCEFSTGTLVEPIEEMDRPRRLAYAVTHTPPPMTEWNPFGAVDAPHLHGFFEGRRGEVTLEPLPGGRTLLTGTTWYRHRLEPAGYWAAWSNIVIRKVHLRLMRHIRATAEADAAARRLISNPATTRLY